jgi:membrane-associated phospholipid phosphatase
MLRSAATATPVRVRRRLDVAWIVGGLLVLVLAGLGAADGEVDGWEQAVFHAINGLPASLEPVMRVVELLGVLVVGPAVAVVAFGLRKPRLAAAALLVTVAKLGLERVVKMAVERQRPATSTPEAIARGVPIRGLAFVSGHAVLVGALAGIISPHLRGGWKAVPWSVLVLVCFARVYLGAHNPLDVAGGAGLGLAIAGGANLLVGVPGDSATGGVGRFRAEQTALSRDAR